MILFSETAKLVRGSESMRALEKMLQDLGLELEVIVSPEGGAFTGLTLAEAERQGRGAFFVVQLNRRGGESLSKPRGDLRIGAGDGLVVVVKGHPGAVSAMFHAPREPMKVGRMRQRKP
jgi:Trk K+ transport system NAD-binding subunit